MSRAGPVCWMLFLNENKLAVRGLPSPVPNTKSSQPSTEEDQGIRLGNRCAFFWLVSTWSTTIGMATARVIAIDRYS